ncbi:MAG TPA: hypothetical protein VF712_01110 [Thermoleophilaceae bacterium]
MASDHARRVDHLLGMQGGDERERALFEGEITSYDPLDTGASGGTYVATFPDGSAAYHKRHDSLHTANVHAFGHDVNGPPLHECAAWHFAKALGPRYERLLPTTVYRRIEGRWGSLAAELPGTKPGRPAFVHAVDQVNDAGFFDVLIGQQDRHGNNFLWDAEGGRLGLFDHGFAFPAVGAEHRVRSAVLRNQRRWKQMKLTDEEVELIERVLGSGDLLGITPLLEPERADEMTRRLESLGEHRMIPRV